MRRGLTLGLLVATLLASCAPQANPSAPKPPSAASGPSRITIIQGAQPVETMNPYAQSAGLTYMVWKHVLETLVHWDSVNRQMQPLLAE